MKSSYFMQHKAEFNLSIEKLVEAELLELGENYCRPDEIIGTLFGEPNFLVPKYKAAIFCDAPDENIVMTLASCQLVDKQLKQDGWESFHFCELNFKQKKNKPLKALKHFIDKKNENKSHFTFVDLFSGVGGFRYALENLGGKCLGFSEVDKNAIEIYKKNFNDPTEVELGDITKIKELPFYADLIVGGVPCQSWSIAGKMKGFDDPRGKLWGDVVRLVKKTKPKAFIFENVKGLADPRNKKNLQYIIREFEKLDYHVTYKVINSYDFGVPQNRERIYIVGTTKEFSKKKIFEYPVPTNAGHKLHQFIDDMLIDSKDSKKKMSPEEIFDNGKVPGSRNRFQKSDEFNDFFIFSDTRNGHTTVHSWELIKTTKRDKEICMLILKNRRKKIYGESDGNPIPFSSLKKLDGKITKDELTRLIDKNIVRLVKGVGYEFVNSKNSSGINGIYRVFLPRSSIFSTLTATGTRDFIALKNVNGDSSESYKQNFINEIIKGKQFRPISGKDGGKLQGFPSNMQIPRKDKIALKQFGNAVSVPVVEALGRKLIGLELLNSNKDLYIKYG